MTPATLLTELKRGPDCLLQDLDLVNRRGLLVQLNEAIYRGASFLDHRALQPDTAGAWFPLPQLLEEARDIRPARPAHFIFHVSHCGSTLVSRLLAELPRCLPIREPLTLLSLAQQYRELDNPASRLDAPGWDALFNLSVRLLSRSYRGEQVIIKATSACSNLLPLLPDSSPGSRTLLLYADLETWLSTMLRNESVRENGRFYAAAWLKDFLTLTGQNDLRLATLTDAEQFTINWLTGMLHFEHARTAAPEQVLQMDFEDFLAAPAASLHKLGGFFGLETARAEELCAGPLMRAYAKNPKKPFDAARRRQELAEARTQMGAEIETGFVLAERLMKDIPALARLGSRLRR